MTIQEAMRARHSVRAYTQQPLEEGLLTRLKEAVDRGNRDGRLSMELCLNAPEAFRGFTARYGKLDNVNHYLALAGPKGSDLEERCGYYGEEIVLLAQQMGLNSCWVAGTYSREKVPLTLSRGEKLVAVITLGYGQNQGFSHKNRPLAELYSAPEPAPGWFMAGMDAVLLAPTAMNQQKFHFTLEGSNGVRARAGKGFYTQIDLGIGKRHFEIGAGDGDWHWVE